MTPQEIFDRLIGEWKGTCRTWFEPEKLADESEVVGTISGAFGGKILRHAYDGMMQGKKRHGEELIAYNAIAKVFEVSWADDFHMNSAILFSQGPLRDNGFSVLGAYDAAEGHPKWGWRTTYTVIDADHLTITAFNILPTGEEAKAVETVYGRVNR